MVLCHHGRRHCKQNTVGVYQADLLTSAHKCHRLALHHLDANPVWKHSHHRGPLHPGNLFQLPAPLGQRNKEDVAPNVFAKDRQHLRTAHLGQASSFNVAGPGNAKARIALQVGLEKEGTCSQAAQDDQSAQPEKRTAPHARWPPPGGARPIAARSVETDPTGRPPAGARGVVFRGRHLQRHAGQSASRGGHTLLHTPEARLRKRFILPYQGTSCVPTLNRHA